MLVMLMQWANNYCQEHFGPEFLKSFYDDSLNKRGWKLHEGRIKYEYVPEMATFFCLVWFSGS